MEYYFYTRVIYNDLCKINLCVFDKLTSQQVNVYLKLLGPLPYQ